MKTVLLIEDNDDIRENMAEIMELSNYTVITAANGKLGVELAFKHTPDIIVCDIMMPILDGYGVIHALQKNESTRNIPFIFLTAKAERSEIRKGMELGADDYITKPFNGTELLSAIESRLRKVDTFRQQLSANIDGLNEIISHAGGDELLHELAKERSVNHYKKKQIIYAEGNHPVRLFYIEKGKIKTYKTNDDGKEFVMGLYNEGDFFGYLALLEGTPYKETAEALEETEIAVIPKEEFDKLVSSNREVMQKFIQLLAKNVTEKEHQLLSIAYNSLRKKVADALVALNKKYKTHNENYVIDISRENLATIAGTAKESLIRTLSDFKEEKLIDIRGGDIVILNEKKLENLLN
ncbi:MAG: response regulator [Bacteroidetes bacterium]|nr:response regulator [Bacteroidota bacterium]MBS1740191.1 response regulator [Bacteroidota bacterium]